MVVPYYAPLAFCRLTYPLAPFRIGRGNRICSPFPRRKGGRGDRSCTETETNADRGREVS